MTINMILLFVLIAGLLTGEAIWLRAHRHHRKSRAERYRMAVGDQAARQEPVLSEAAAKELVATARTGIEVHQAGAQRPAPSLIVVASSTASPPAVASRVIPVARARTPYQSAHDSGPGATPTARSA